MGSYLVNGGAHVEGRFGAAVIDLSKKYKNPIYPNCLFGERTRLRVFLNYPVVLRQKINVVKDEAVEASERF